jgi:cell wall-associated NlpC family hydrolase
VRVGVSILFVVVAIIVNLIAPLPVAAAKVESKAYQIRQGDTLWALARRHGTTPEQLARINGIKTKATLSIGQRLRLPAAGARVAARTRPAVEVRPSVRRQASTARPRVARLPSRGSRWASKVVALSTRFLGVRYVWGGTSPEGFDCSGLTYYVFGRTGITLPRTTYDMFEAGTPVPEDQLQTGDFVFFETLQPGPSHAGIYLGDGRFIHSSSGFGQVTITPMNHRYYAPRYLGARRF